MDKYEAGMAAAGAVLGGIATKAIDAIFRHKNKQLDDAAAIRGELRAEIKRLTERMDRQDKEIENWRSKYYSLIEENTQLKNKCISLKSEIEGLRREMHCTPGGPCPTPTA